MKSKKHRKKKATPAVAIAPSGFVADIKFGGFNIPGSVIRAFHKQGKMHHAKGKEDKSNAMPLMPFEDFMAQTTTSMPQHLKAFEDTFNKAAHAQYIDGYEGRPYYDRIVFKREDI